MKYEEVYEDWSYLFHGIGVADDMTGGYVDSEDLNKMLKNPTKVQAKICLRDQIDYWFNNGCEIWADTKWSKNPMTVFKYMQTDSRVQEIAEKYNVIYIDGEI